MKRKRIYAALTGVMLATIVSLALVFAVFGGQPIATTGDAASAAIQVSGHWTIEVREPDGTLVSRHEFDNALSQFGDDLISKVLAGDVTAGLWVVILDSEEAFLNIEGNPWGLCWIVESSYPEDDIGTHIFRTLTVTATDVLSFSGAATAEADGEIGEVATGLSCCNANETPIGCISTVVPQPIVPSANYWQNLTETTLIPMISVVAGQQILVEVVISFSGE